MNLPSSVNQIVNRFITENGLRILGHVYFFMLFIFSAIYYQERTIYIDSANQLFEIINKEGFEIFVGRYSMIFSQLLPLLCVKLLLPLKYVVLAYSLSFTAVLYTVFLINAYVFKNTLAAIIPCFAYLAASHTFFHAISETIQVISFASLFYASLHYLLAEQNGGKKAFKIALCIFIALINLYMHPVAVFFLAFAMASVALEFKCYFRWEWISLAGFSVLFFIVKTIFFSEGTHDATFLAELKQIDVLSLEFISSPLRYLKTRFFKLYAFISILSLLATLVLIHNKEWIKIAFYYSFVGAFLVISLLVYHKGDSDIGMERSFLPLAFFSAVLFLTAFHKIKNTRSMLITTLVLLLSIGVGAKNIYVAGKEFSNRTNEVKKLLSAVSKVAGQKFFIERSLIQEKNLIVSYNLAIESMLYSSLGGSENTKTLYLKTEPFINDLQASDQWLYTNYWRVRYTNELNLNYFQLKGAYRKWKDKPFQNSFFQFDHIVQNSESSSDGTFANAVTNLSYASFISAPTSLKMLKQEEFSCEIVNYDLLANDSLEVRYFKKGIGKSGLVISNESDYYRFIGEEKTSSNPNWHSIKEVFQLPEKLNNYSFKLYFWKPINQEVLFDNLSIKTKRGNELIQFPFNIVEDGYVIAKTGQLASVRTGLSKEVYRSFPASLMMNPNEEFAAEIRELNLKENAHVNLSVYTFGPVKAGIVISNELDYYQFITLRELDPKTNWQRISGELKLPTNLKSYTFKIYLWNPEAEKVYFDDLQVNYAKP